MSIQSDRVGNDVEFFFKFTCSRGKCSVIGHNLPVRSLLNFLGFAYRPVACKKFLKFQLWDGTALLSVRQFCFAYIIHLLRTESFIISTYNLRVRATAQHEEFLFAGILDTTEKKNYQHRSAIPLKTHIVRIVISLEKIFFEQTPLGFFNFVKFSDNLQQKRNAPKLPSLF